ncbi:MAG TPA: nucleotidyltransferase family protein, partial [Pyrinomonadaceae bacterium]|nr:nucleotidyltransferase family protein [Pyrinomonadaceae bacterium]
MLSLRPEDQVLLCIARPAADPETNERLRQLLDSDLDWNCLLAAAERHCVISLLHRHLAATTAAAVPAQALKQLQHAINENTNSNLFLTGELVKLLHLLQANKIQAIPFKGPTLALAAYGDIG